MGFSGGGSNILKPHKHNSLVLQDGGNLDFTGSETQSDMSAGSTTYSNGSHLQELVKPVTPTNDVLTFATGATAPSWLPGAKHELLDTHTATGTESTYTFTPSPALDLDAKYQEIISFFNGKTSDSLTLQAEFNGITEYHTTITKNQLGTITGIHNGSATQIDLIDTGINNVARNCQCVLHITKVQINGTLSPFAYYGVANSPARATQQYGGGTITESGDTITSLTWQTDTSTWTANTTINTFGVLKA